MNRTIQIKSRLPDIRDSDPEWEQIFDDLKRKEEELQQLRKKLKKAFTVDYSFDRDVLPSITEQDEKINQRIEQLENEIKEQIESIQNQLNESLQSIKGSMDGVLSKNTDEIIDTLNGLFGLFHGAEQKRREVNYVKWASIVVLVSLVTSHFITPVYKRGITFVGHPVIEQIQSLIEMKESSTERIGNLFSFFRRDLSDEIVKESRKMLNRDWTDTSANFVTRVIRTATKTEIATIADIPPEGFTAKRLDSPQPGAIVWSDSAVGIISSSNRVITTDPEEGANKIVELSLQRFGTINLAIALAKAEEKEKEKEEKSPNKPAREGTDISSSTSSSSSRKNVTWIDPVANMRTRFRFTSDFGYRIHPISKVRRLHAGIDIGTPTGTPLVAPAAGRVLRVINNAGCGRGMEIAHANNINTVYCHLSTVRVRQGQQVTQGQVIGETGNTGASTGPHLHFETKVNGAHVHPKTVNPKWSRW